MTIDPITTWSDIGVHVPTLPTENVGLIMALTEWGYSYVCSSDTTTTMNDWIGRIADKEPDMIPQSALWQPVLRVTHVIMTFVNKRYQTPFMGHCFPVGGSKK